MDFGVLTCKRAVYERGRCMEYSRFERGIVLLTIMLTISIT